MGGIESNLSVKFHNDFNEQRVRSLISETLQDCRQTTKIYSTGTLFIDILQCLQNVT